MKSVWVVQQEYYVDADSRSSRNDIEVYEKYEDARKTYEDWIADAKNNFAETHGYEQEDLSVMEREDWCEMEVGNYDFWCEFKIYEKTVR